jgi:hypothetical protein
MRKDSAALRNILILGGTVVVLVVVSALIARYVI